MRNAVTSGIDAIAAERKRQIEEEGWTAEHDDQWTEGQLVIAAVCYARAWPRNPAPLIWPFNTGWWKPKSRRENLVRAGALIAAEIDRLDRAARKEGR